MVARRPWPWTATVDCLVLLLWGLMLVRFWASGLLSLLLHPDYQWLSNGAAIWLLAMGTVQSWQLARLIAAGARWPRSEGHIALLPRRFSTLLLLGVAVFGLVFTPKPFSSETALQRGLTDPVGQTRSQPQRFVRQKAPDQRTIIDWVRTLNVYPEPDAYGGQPVDLSGFVIHPPGWPADTFMISRFVLTCCAADAYPVGLPVLLPDGQSRPQPDQWLAVRGTMTTTTLAEKRQLAIAPAALEEIEPPRNPYEY